MDNSQIMAVAALVLSAAGTVFAAVNHRRVRSNCCGRLLEASIDVEATTPPLHGATAPVLTVRQPTA
jgi:hypothetical protein